MAYEEPSFAVVQANEAYEIRYYEERIVVQTRNTNQNSGFRKLFNYISGKNSNSEKIAMTVPVTQTDNLMQFYLPIKFDLENTPIPIDGDVKISTIPGGHYAVIKYGGRSSDSNFLKHAKFLRGYMQARSRGHASVEVGNIDSKRGCRGSRRIHHVQRARSGGECHDVGGGETPR